MDNHSFSFVLFRALMICRGFLFLLCSLGFLHFHGADFAGKAEKVDKAFRVVMVVQVAGGKGGNAFII